MSSRSCDSRPAAQELFDRTCGLRVNSSSARSRSVVRGSLVYRAFCRIDCERVPDAKTLIRLAALLGPAVLKNIVERLVHLAQERRVVRGHRLRVDTMVVETNIHYPTDSTLLADGVRVLTRTMRRICADAGASTPRVARSRLPTGLGDDPDASAIPQFVGREHARAVAHGP